MGAFCAAVFGDFGLLSLSLNVGLAHAGAKNTILSSAFGKNKAKCQSLGHFSPTVVLNHPEVSENLGALAKDLQPSLLLV